MNPDTKASALMLLAKSTASTNAEYILHNSIQLFTFVGTHFLQMESKSSFEIACTAIDVLVPHILSGRGLAGKYRGLRYPDKRRVRRFLFRY